MKTNYNLLILQDGTTFRGTSFGAAAPALGEFEQDLSRPESTATHDPAAAPRNAVTPEAAAAREKAVGEVVFNTAMSGYHEVLTDPSYTGQLVAMTYPHIGNYGTSADWSEIGPESGCARTGVKPAGFIVRKLYTGPIPAGRQSLHEFLAAHGTPGISGVDTRRLTLCLREHGSATGVILQAPNQSDGSIASEELARVLEYLNAFPTMEGRNLVGAVGTREPVVFNEGGTPRLALLDCGLKANIIRELTKRGAEVTVIPSDAEFEQLSELKSDALFLSNGPGDPAVLQQQVALVRDTVGRLPVLGICLGHQLIAEALGAKTYKMKFGHHGINHPVRDELTGKVFVTSQNHGFAVDESTLPSETTVWFKNANDGSNEGIMDRGRRVLSAQFHPESAPGPTDSAWIFDAFLDALKER